MQQKFKKMALLSMVVSSCMVLSACSKGNSVSNSHQSTNKQASTVYEGRLIDAQIEGVTYKTATRTGVTDKNGKFFYDKMGEKIEFFVGNQNIGEAIATSEVHIYDIEPTISSRSDERKRYVERLAQTLQILDSDNNPENGIQLTDANRYKLEKILDVDVGSTSLQEILLKSPTEYVQDSLKKYAEEVGDFAKTWVSPEQANQHANRNKVCTSIADSTYYLPGVQDKFSTQGRTCREKAQAIAFYEDVALDMGSTAVQFHSDFLENTNEQTIHAGIKHAVETNIVANAINATAKYMASFGKVKSLVSDEQKQQALKITMQETLKFLSTSLEFVQKTACTGKSPEECEEINNAFKSSLLPAIFDIVATECSFDKENVSKCVEMATKIIDKGVENRLIVLNNEQQKKLAKDITNTALFSAKTISNLVATKNAQDKADILKISGEMIDDVIKFSTGYNVRDDEESAVRNAWVNLIEKTGDVAKTTGSCAGVFYPNTTINPISAFGECLENVNKYAFQNVAEILGYSIAIHEINNANDSLANSLIAQAYLAEVIRLGDETKIYGVYSGTSFDKYKKLPYPRQRYVIEEIFENLAKKIDVPNPLHANRPYQRRENLVKISELISLYRRVIDSKANQILAGKAGSKATIELGNITSPQLIKYARPPKLTADNYRVDINKPIYFTATHKLDKSIIGYQISILGAENKTIYSDLPVLQYTFTKAGDYQLTMTPVIRKTNGGTFPIPAKSQTLAFNVLEDKTTKITNITTTPQQITTGQQFELIITGSNLPTDNMFTVNGCTTQTKVSLAVDKHIYKCTAPANATDNYNLSVVGTDGKTAIFNKQFKVTATTVPPITPTATKLTATGITLCGDDRQNNIACSSLSSAWLGLMQDGEVQAGQKMSYTVLNQNGAECVRDNVTGLTWEQKTDDGGLRDKDNTYTWYNPDNRTNGGSAGEQNNGKNTLEYIKQLNAMNYCGYNDWRLPTKNELRSIVDYGRYNPATHPIFSNTQSSYYWSSSPHALSSEFAWGVSFNSGNSYDNGRYKYDSFYVRAVR